MARAPRYVPYEYSWLVARLFHTCVHTIIRCEGEREEEEKKIESGFARVCGRERDRKRVVCSVANTIAVSIPNTASRVRC